jgi:hypothetical protein
MKRLVFCAVLALVQAGSDVYAQMQFRTIHRHNDAIGYARNSHDLDQANRNWKIWCNHNPDLHASIFCYCVCDQNRKLIPYMFMLFNADKDKEGFDKWKEGWLAYFKAVIKRKEGCGGCVTEPRVEVFLHPTRGKKPVK